MLFLSSLQFCLCVAIWSQRCLWLLLLCGCHGVLSLLPWLLRCLEVLLMCCYEFCMIFPEFFQTDFSKKKTSERLVGFCCVWYGCRDQFLSSPAFRKTGRLSDRDTETSYSVQSRTNRTNTRVWCFHILLSVVFRSVSGMSVASFYTCWTFPEETFITPTILRRHSNVSFRHSNYASDDLTENSWENQ